MTFKATIAALAAALWSCGSNSFGQDLAIQNLRCEYRVNPAGIDRTRPRLSWELSSRKRGQSQTAFRILVASSLEILGRDKGDLWDTDKVQSDETIHIVYAGTPLQSRMVACWKVAVWDENNQLSAWSAPGFWTMGLLQRSDWQAKWIADPVSVTNAAPSGPLNGYHSQLTNNAGSAKWVAFDLGKPQSIEAVRLFPARPYDWRPDTPGFLFPVRFKIESSAQPDFSDARVLVDRTGRDEPNPGTNATVYRFAPAVGQFIRLTVTRLGLRDANNFGFALAEMQVLRGETNLAQSAKVLAMDSIETGPWASTNLNDGVLLSVNPSSAVPGALPATMLRKSFQLLEPIKRATTYATALGLYELRLNGQRVGDQLLAPEWTNYRKRVQYQTYDVTALLRQGDNAIGAMLGEGWYAGRLMAMPRFPYGSHPSLLLQLEIELANGGVQTISTDSSWRSTTEGPIRSAGIYDGEAYDARQEMSGWDLPGFDTASWRPVQTFDLGQQQLNWQCNEPIKVVKELAPIGITEPKPGVYIFDFGQNMVGWCRIRAQGEAARTVTLRHAEMLNDDGSLYTANLRGAPQVDRYTPRAGGEFEFEPRFTYHGFRFLELTGAAQMPSTNSVIGRVFHSSSAEAGHFRCSDPSLNQLLQNILWTQRANLMSSPNDCPQRDERFGWMGDIQAFGQTAILNMDLAAFFTKFLQDIRDDQAEDGRYPDFAPHPGDPNRNFSGAPAWADAGTILPWRVWQNYADKRLLADHFDSARRWVDYVHAENPDLIWAKSRHNDYNDWLNGDWVKQAGWPSQGGSVPKEVFATAFFAHSTELVAKMAAALGRGDDAQRYGKLFKRIKAAFNQQFVNSDGHIKGGTQGGYALALNFNLLPEDLVPKARELLVQNIHDYQNHLSTGIQTTHRTMLELTRGGRNDLAWQLLTNRTFPSWLYMIDNGATTIWERWDGYVKGRGFQDAGMNSFNHWAFGAVGEWMWRNILGLNPDEAQPGWKHFLIAPRPGGGVTWAQGEYHSIRGAIALSWSIKNNRFLLELVVPPNCSATVRMPVSDATSLTDGGKPIAEVRGVDSLRHTNDGVFLEVISGSYLFEGKLAP